MPGIVTSTSGGSSVKTYRAVFTSTSTSLAINWVTGSTSTGGSALPADKGVFVIFQNQSSATNATIGGPDVTPNAQGIVLGILSTVASNTPSSYTVFSAGSFSSIQMTDWYVTSTSSVGIVVAQLVRGV